MNTELLIRIGRIVFFPVQVLFHVLARLAYVVASVLAVLSALVLTIGVIPMGNDMVGVVKDMKLPQDDVLFK